MLHPCYGGGNIVSLFTEILKYTDCTWGSVMRDWDLLLYSTEYLTCKYTVSFSF
jgi:hypothetical protein